MGGEHEAVESTGVTPEPIWFANKRVWRTALQSLVSYAAVLGVVAGIFPDVTKALTSVLPGPWIIALGSFGVFLAALAAALAKIMAIPAVNTFLTRYLGLGSVPKSEAPTALERAAGSGPAQITDGSDRVS